VCPCPVSVVQFVISLDSTQVYVQAHPLRDWAEDSAADSFGKSLQE